MYVIVKLYDVVYNLVQNVYGPFLSEEGAYAWVEEIGQKDNELYSVEEVSEPARS